MLDTKFYLQLFDKNESNFFLSTEGAFPQTRVILMISDEITILFHNITWERSKQIPPSEWK
jgi:hypothetical protein